MSLISTLIALFLLGAVLVTLFWVGFYVVLPIVLFFIVVSAVVSMVKKFTPQTAVPKSSQSHQKNESNQIIDVEYEEIK